MINGKKIICMLLSFVAFTFIGCNSKDNSEKIIDLYDLEKGKAVANDYLNYICDDDIEKANELCSESLLEKNKSIEQGVSKITSYQIDKTVASNDYCYFIYNVIRTSKEEPKSDLESYTIKVVRNNENYTIDEVKAKSEKELFVKGKALRIIGEDGGKSSLIITLNNFPKDSYMKENKIMLYKQKVPTDNFGKVVLGFNGKKVAISTTGNDSTYIAVATIDDSLMEIASVETAPQGTGSSNVESQLQDTLERPVISKLISMDLLKNVTVEKFIFSNDDSTLAVNYKDNNGGSRVKLYQSNDGSPVTTDFDENFPADKYNIEGVSFQGDVFKFKVNNKENSESSIAGDYEINLGTLEVNKL